MIYQMKEAIIGYPGNILLNRVSIEIRDREKICIVGRNGCGKSTLLKVIAGELEPDNDNSDEAFQISKAGNIKIGYLKQMSFKDEAQTVRDELFSADMELNSCQQKLDKLTSQMAENATEQIMEEYAKTLNRFETMGGYGYTAEMEKIFTKFGFKRSELDKSLSTFSGGQKTKIALVKLLLSKPDICLLDEPTNHLDLPAIEWLQKYLKAYAGAVVIVSHDRMFLDEIVNVTYDIEHHMMKRYAGNYTAFVKQKQLDYEKQCKDYEAQQKEIERLTFFIEKWKNTPTKVSMTRSKRMQIEHMVKIPKPIRFNTKPIMNHFQPQKESAAEVLNVRGLKIGYTEELAEVSFQLKRGQRLAVLGENGRGKSTLLKTIVKRNEVFGDENGYSNYITFGRDVEWAYYDQELQNFDETKTVIEDFWNTYPDLDRTQIRTVLGNFLFSGEDVDKPIKQLSGGEKVRLSLAKIMRKQANLLIMDEPTNHLDMVGKEALETILKKYQGTILFVSHDRYFIQSLATNLLCFEKEKVNYYPFDYRTYLLT